MAINISQKQPEGKSHIRVYLREPVNPSKAPLIPVQSRAIPISTPRDKDGKQEATSHHPTQGLGPQPTPYTRPSCRRRHGGSAYPTQLLHLARLSSSVTHVRAPWGCPHPLSMSEQQGDRAGGVWSVPPPVIACTRVPLTPVMPKPQHLREAQPRGPPSANESPLCFHSDEPQAPFLLPNKRRLECITTSALAHAPGHYKFSSSVHLHTMVSTQPGQKGAHRLHISVPIASLSAAQSSPLHLTVEETET